MAAETLRFSPGVRAKPPYTLKAFACLKFALTLCIFFLFSFGSWCLQESLLPASWLVTAGKMRDFWGQMCFCSIIIMPLKILIALAVFLGGPGPGRRQLTEETEVFPEPGLT